MFKNSFALLLRNIFTFLLTAVLINASAQTQGPSAGSSSSNITLSGSTSITSNGGNAYASDNVYASNSTNLASNGNYSDYLSVAGFGFSIPSGSTIDGIEVVIERSNPNGKIKDNIVSLIKGGTIGGNNYASSVTWPVADGTITYGNGTDLWGNTWADSDINSSAFGIAFSWKRNGGGASTAYASIDLLTIKVYYTVPLPIQLAGFIALALSNSVKLTWKTNSEINNNYFTVQRSAGLETVIDIASVPGAENSSVIRNYSAVDENPLPGISYYRLKQTDYNGQFTYSLWVKINFNQNNKIKIVPNPAEGNTVNIILPSAPSSSCRVFINDITGKLLFEKKIIKDLANDFLSISGLPLAEGGMFFLTVELDGKIYKEKFNAGMEGER